MAGCAAVFAPARDRVHRGDNDWCAHQRWHARSHLWGAAGARSRAGGPGAACGSAIDASIGISPSIVLKRHANGPSRARDSRSAPAHKVSSRHRSKFEPIDIPALSHGSFSVSVSWCNANAKDHRSHLHQAQAPALVHGARTSMLIGASLLKLAPTGSAAVAV